MSNTGDTDNFGNTGTVVKVAGMMRFGTDGANSINSIHYGKYINLVYGLNYLVDFLLVMVFLLIFVIEVIEDI